MRPVDVAPQVIVGPQLLQRMLRVEEELQNLRQTMETRFAAQQAAIAERFAAMDKRFDSQQAVMKAQQWIVIVGFVVLGTVVSLLGLAA